MKFITTLLLLIYASVSFSAPLNPTINRTGVDNPVEITIITFDSKVSLQRKYAELNGLRYDDVRKNNRSLEGFARWNENADGTEPEQKWCKIFIVKPKADSRRYNETLGHEMLHCMYGSFHEH